jgi:4-diphosphocytidyl-2-C-methyl-D-erythritol kinase
MEERAYAKVNLSLRLIRRRPDGFHEIESLIAPVSLCDCLRVERASTFEFTCNDPHLSTGEDNLVVRAARLFFEQTKIPPGVRIVLDKRIPCGAGLGGGSSDAAATLRLLQNFFGVSLPDLPETAARLGSDVPFFLQPAAAVCRGRGEIIERIALPGKFHLLLLKPAFAVATGWAYARWDSTRKTLPVTRPEQKLNKLRFFNDLEGPVFEKFVFLSRMKGWLRDQPEVAVSLLSGSGSTVFAVLREAASADSLMVRARAELDPKLWACQCENISHPQRGETLSHERQRQ